jgi:membrane-bound metal-dependent hydrolase YbcI (DUF457 family)
LLVATVVILVVAASSRRSYRRTRLGVVGALALVLLDAVMVGAAPALAPTMGALMSVAMLASISRIAVAIRSLPATITASR